MHARSGPCCCTEYNRKTAESAKCSATSRNRLHNYVLDTASARRMQNLPIRRHIRMKSTTATHHIPNHPGSRLRKRTLSRTKQSLNSRYQRYIEALRDFDSDDEISSREQCKSMMQSIHTNEVKDYIDTREDNKVLNSPAPEISADEEKLRRKSRRILAQLRSGYSPHLRAYLKRTGIEDSDLCPDCKKEKHTTIYLTVKQTLQVCACYHSGNPQQKQPISSVTRR